MTPPTVDLTDAKWNEFTRLPPVVPPTPPRRVTPNLLMAFGMCVGLAVAVVWVWMQIQ